VSDSAIVCDRVQAQWTGYAPGADTCPSAAMCLVLGRLSTVVCGEKIEQSEPDGCELLDSWVALCPGRVSRVQGKLLVDSWQGRVSVDVLEAGSMIIGGWLSAVPSATSANCTQSCRDVPPTLDLYRPRLPCDPMPSCPRACVSCYYCNISLPVESDSLLASGR